MDTDDIVEKHPSFGVVTLNRYTVNPPVNLFYGRAAPTQQLSDVPHARRALFTRSPACLDFGQADRTAAWQSLGNVHLYDLPPMHKTPRTALQRHMRGHQPDA